MFWPIVGSLMIGGFSALLGLMVALRLRRTRSLALAIGAGLVVAGAGLGVAAVSLAVELWPRAHDEHPREQAARREVRQVVTLVAPSPSEQPSDAELLEKLVGSASGRFQTQYYGEMTAAVQSRQILLSGNYPSLLVLFTVTAPSEDKAGALPIRGLRYIGALEAFKTGNTWNYRTPQPTLVTVPFGSGSYAVSVPEVFDIGTGLSGVKWKVMNEQNGAIAETTYLGWLDGDGLKVTLTADTGFTARGARSDGPAACVLRKGDLEMKFPSGGGIPMITLTTRVSDCDTGAKATWRSEYGINPEHTQYLNDAAPTFVEGSAPTGGGWNINYNYPNFAPEGTGVGIDDTWLCANGVALYAEAPSGATDQVTQGRWTQDGVKANVRWERKATWSTEDGEVGDQPPTFGPPGEADTTLVLADESWFAEMEGSTTISRDDSPCQNVLSTEGLAVGTAPFTSTRRIEDADLAGKSKAEIQSMLLELQARRGATFEGEADRNLAADIPWYRPLISTDQAFQLMTPIERNNLDRLRAALITSDPAQQELITVLTGIQRAERAFSKTAYVPAEHAPRPIDGINADLIAWNSGADWGKVGYDPLGPVRGSYWIEVDPGGKDYVAHGLAMGEGGPVEYSVTQSRAPMRVP